MNKKDLAEIKKILEKEKADLEAELAKFTKKNPHNPENYEAQFEEVGNDESENSSEVAQYGFNLSLEKTLEKSLRDVNKSLERVEKNNYGLCQYCKQEIDIKRLKARPTSSACVSCKTKLKSL